MKRKKKITVNAVLDTELETLLKSTAYFEDLISGKIICKGCGTIITAENIGILMPQKENEKTIIDFYCERIDCIDEFKHHHGKV
jgi:hypothetical protein